MWDLISIVTPRVKAYWKYLAYSMGYSIHDVTAWERNVKDPSDQCTNLFEAWLTGKSSCTPKTQKTLLERIKAVDALDTAGKEIENALRGKK